LFLILDLSVGSLCDLETYDGVCKSKVIGFSTDVFNLLVDYVGVELSHFGIRLLYYCDFVSRTLRLNVEFAHGVLHIGMWSF